MSIKDPKYGIPQLKKFPMPDARHVRSAIKFFNYVTPKYEKQLAAAIIRRMKEYGLSFDDFTVGDENRFSKYVPKRTTTMNNNYLAHYGILGMHWGIRRFQPYPKGYTGDGKFTGKKLTPRRMNKEQNKVYSLYGKGMTVDQISKKTGINRDAVNDYLDGGFGPVKGKAAKAGAERASNGGLVIPTKEQDLSMRSKRDKDVLYQWEIEEVVDALEKADYYKTPEKLVQGKNKMSSYFDGVIEDIILKSEKKPVTEKEIKRAQDCIVNKLDQRQKDSAINLYVRNAQLDNQVSKMEQEWMDTISKDPQIKKLMETWSGDGTEMYYELQYRKPNEKLDEMVNARDRAWQEWENGCKAIGADVIPPKYVSGNKNSAITYKTNSKYIGVEKYPIRHLAKNAVLDMTYDYEQKVKAMAKSGKTYEQIANSLGISESSVGKLVNL